MEFSNIKIGLTAWVRRFRKNKDLVPALPIYITLGVGLAVLAGSALFVSLPGGAITTYATLLWAVLIFSYIAYLVVLPCVILTIMDSSPGKERGAIRVMFDGREMSVTESLPTQIKLRFLRRGKYKIYFFRNEVLEHVCTADLFQEQMPHMDIDLN